MKKLPIGISDFRDMVTGDFYYVDKTLFIKDIMDKGDKIMLIPRPRRFGKTLNISMIAYYYDCCPEKLPMDSEGRFPTNRNDLPRNSYKDLFRNFNISGAGSEYTDKMGKHPVIFLSFRSIKNTDWETCFTKIKSLIQIEYLKHKYLLASNELQPEEKDYFKKIIELRGDKGDYETSLEMLLIFLSRYYEERVVILIDEYDAPVHAGYFNNYYDQVVDFLRNFLCSGLKDTDKYLEKSIVTGILRIAKESIFSGLNNLGVYTLLAYEFGDKFGFTETEVEKFLIDFNLLDHHAGVQQWYNGYRFGKETIFNPWSIISFLGYESHMFQPYWLNTSDNQLINSLLSTGGAELKIELEQLIRGESIKKHINENIVMKEITAKDDALWSFLLMSGYLKYTGYEGDGKGKILYSLSIPNLEVRIIYESIISDFFSTKIKSKKTEAMLEALVEGDIDFFEERLQEVVAAVFSYHDLSEEPEKVYHAFVTGLLVWLSASHEIKSNRESGFGRYDIMIIPKNPDKIGYVIEFKTINTRKNETIETATETALKQIEEKKYETELIERGIHRIKKLAIVFKGKEVVVKEKI